MNWGYGVKALVLIAALLTALGLFAHSATAWSQQATRYWSANYGYTSGVSTPLPGFNTHSTAGLTQPQHPQFTAWESRPSGYGLVQQGPAYSPRAPVYEDPRFAGHRSQWDPSRSVYDPTYYSGVTGAPRVTPQLRVQSQERYVPKNAQRYVPQNPHRLPTMQERQRTWYGTWSVHP